MNFQDLHELLRVELLRRIDRGILTGSRLAQQSGFQQAHISNFLNRKRSLSLEGLDRVLASQELTVDQLLPLEIDAAESYSSPAAMDGSYSQAGSHADSHAGQGETIPVVSPSAAMDHPRIAPSAVLETLQVSASRLYDHRADRSNRANRTHPASRLAHWQRFVAIRADAQQSASMAPIIAPGAIAVLDRHYTSLAPYRGHQPNLYAARCGAALLLRFVDFDEGRLMLRPWAREFPVQLIPLAAHETPSDYIVGRVCLLFSEL